VGRIAPISALLTSWDKCCRLLHWNDWKNPQCIRTPVSTVNATRYNIYRNHPGFQGKDGWTNFATTPVIPPVEKWRRTVSRLRGSEYVTLWPSQAWRWWWWWRWWWRWWWWTNFTVLVFCVLCRSRRTGHLIRSEPTLANSGYVLEQHGLCYTCIT